MGYENLMPHARPLIPYTDSDAGEVAMGTTVSVQITDEQMARLEREAKRLGESPVAVARLKEESLRESEFPRIEFRDSAAGR